MADASATVRRNRIKLVLIFLLFFGPTLAAWILFESGWRPGGTVNHGQLVEPVQPAGELNLTDEQGQPMGHDQFIGHWSMLLSSSEPCGEPCMETLNQLGRVHVALNKDMDRVQPGLILPTQAPMPELPARVWQLRADPAQLEALAAGSESGIMAVHLFDFRGMRMMTYPVPLDASGMLKDIRRLLRLSNEEAERLQKQREAAQ